MKNKFPPISTRAAKEQAFKDMGADKDVSTYPLQKESLICQGNPNKNIIPFNY